MRFKFKFPWTKEEARTTAKEIFKSFLVEVLKFIQALEQELLKMVPSLFVLVTMASMTRLRYTILKFIIGTITKA